MAHTENLIHSILVNGVTYEIHDAQAIHSIEDLNLSSVLKFGGVVANRAALPAADASKEGYVYHILDEDSEVVCVADSVGASTYHWEDFGHAIVTDHVHDVTVTPASTTEASKLIDAGSVVAGTLPKFTAGAFNAGSFTQGEDEFTAGSFTPGSVSLNCTPAAYTQGEDTFAANTPTTLDVTKFKAGSATLNDGSYNAPSASFIQGEDKLTPNTPTVVDVSKFSAGSVSAAPINYVAPVYTPGECTQKVENGVLSFFCTAGSMTAGSVTGGDITYVAPSLGEGFYTPGTAASFSQGKDSFSAGSCAINETPAVYVAPTFTQGQDTYVAPTKAADTFDAGTHTQVTLPTFSTVSGLWNGANASGVSGQPYQPEQA